MNHRHLLPNEIDLLLDGEGGFGMAPLREHAADCPDCRARVEEARFVVDTLENLPHFAPSISLADKVMSKVPVFVPWHVAARDSLEQALALWAPRSRPIRTAAYVAAASVLAIFTITIAWIATRADLLAMAGGMAGDRARDLLAQAGLGLAGSLLGQGTLQALSQAGTTGLALAGGGFLIAAAGTFAGLRRIAATSSARG